MMLNLVCIVGVLLAFASPIVWALQSVTTGFVILQGSYSDKTSCTPSTATSLNWAPMNVCMKLNDGSFVKYSADSSNTVYTSPYTDSACTTVSGTDVKYGSLTCTNGVSFGIYSATRPDAIFNVQSSGYLANIFYASTDTKCTGTPGSATYYPIGSCGQATSTSGGVSSIVSNQYIVDASGNPYSSTYFAGGSCTSPIGSVYTIKLTPTICAGQSSQNVYSASLPPTSATTLFVTNYVATGCTGTVQYIQVSYGQANCPSFTTASCQSVSNPIAGQPQSSSWLCGAGTTTGGGSFSGTKVTTGFAILNGAWTDTAKCTASSAVNIVWIPLNVCVPSSAIGNGVTTGFQLLYADTNSNLFTSAFTDSACMTSTGASDVKLPSTPCTAAPAGTVGVLGPTANMKYVYSATQPDAVFNIQSSGFFTISATYASTDTMCTSIPTTANYINLRTCLPFTNSASSLTPTQFFADASNNIYQTTYSTGTTCTGSTVAGVVNTFKQVPTTCVSGMSSMFFTANLPAATATTQFSTNYAATGCSGTILGTQFSSNANSCPYTTPTCVNQGTSVTSTGAPPSVLITCGTSSTGGSPTNAPIAASGTYDLQSVASALQSNGASVTNALASAYPGITVSNPTVTNDGSVITATQNIPSGVTLTQASIAGGPFQVAYTQAVANSAGVPTSAITGLTASQGRRLLAGVNMNYRINRAVTNFFSGGGVAASPTSSSSSSCFAGTEMLTLASGITKAMSEVQVGDRVLTINAKGEQVFSDVVYLPHGRNKEHATFAQVTTESGRDLKMTMNHMLSAGACALSMLPLVAARQVAVGDCVQTVSGREQVVSIDKVEGKGIYTIITMEELIVVNGIVATPYGGINPTLANLYYNLHRVLFTLFHGTTMVSNGLGWMQSMTEGLWTMLSLSA